VAGVVADDQHFVAQGGDEEQVDLAEDAGHLFGDAPAEAVGLDEIDGGEEAGLAEAVGPRVGDLGFELVDSVGKGELLEGRAGFGEEDEVERVVGPVGEGNCYGGHAEAADGFESGAVYVCCWCFLHPGGEVTDAEALDAGGGVEAEGAGDACQVCSVGARDGVEDEDRVFDGAGHGAELVERPAEGHGAGAGDAAVGGAEAGDAAAHGGADDAAAGLGTDGEADQAGGYG